MYITTIRIVSPESIPANALLRDLDEMVMDGKATVEAWNEFPCAGCLIATGEAGAKVFCRRHTTWHAEYQRRDFYDGPREREQM
jgi:hypothetical protein